MRLFVICGLLLVKVSLVSAGRGMLQKGSAPFSRRTLRTWSPFIWPIRLRFASLFKKRKQINTSHMSFRQSHVANTVIWGIVRENLIRWWQRWKETKWFVIKSPNRFEIYVFTDRKLKHPINVWLQPFNRDYSFPGCNKAISIFFIFLNRLGFFFVVAVLRILLRRDWCEKKAPASTSADNNLTHSSLLQKAHGACSPAGTCSPEWKHFC